MKPHTLVVISGPLTPLGDEEWSMSARVLGGAVGAATAPIPDANLYTYMNEIADDLVAWFTAAATGIPSTVKFNLIKANNIGADGRYSSDITYYRDVSPAVAGGGPSVPGLDIISSVVYSWSTSQRSRGAASRGRVYPPNFGVQHSAGTGKVNQTAVNVALGQAKVFLSALRNVTGTINAAPVLISTKSGDDAWAYIDQVSVDDVIDVQRRRKNQLVSTRTLQVWP